MNKYDILSTPLPSESHQGEELREAVAHAEALGYGVAIEIGVKEKAIADKDKAITVKRLQSMADNEGKKVAVLEALADDAVKDEVYGRAVLQAELKYLKHVQGLIETRCSVGQSFLSNTTSQIKAGIQLN